MLAHLGLVRPAEASCARSAPQDWEAAWHGLFDPYERATGRLLTLTHPVFIRRVMVPFLRLFPFVFERVLDNLAH